MKFRGQEVVRKLFYNGYRLVSIPRGYKHIALTLPWLKSDTEHHFVQYAGNFIQTTSSGKVMDERTVFVHPRVRTFCEKGFEHEQ